MKTTVSYLLLLIVLLSGCNTMRNSKENRKVESASNGVVVRGYCADGWVQNNNKFPVRIKCIWQFKGETTKWIKVLQPGDYFEQYMSHQHAFYIYTLKGTELGFILVDKPGRIQ